VVALLAWLVPAAHLGLILVPPLLVAGIGGGLVISPNTTLTLECVPTRTAGVAAGAMQTGHGSGPRSAPPSSPGSFARWWPPPVATSRTHFQW
jgi:hypothetical protein